MTKKELQTALVGKWLKWDVGTYICNIVELDFEDVRTYRTIGLHLRHKNGKCHYQRFAKENLETLIIKGKYWKYELLNTPDLPHGTVVMCKPKRGEHWVVQLYRKAGCTTDYESSTSTNTGWVSICPLDRFKPTSRTWMPDERDDYARK